MAPLDKLSREPAVSAQQLHITLAGREHVVDAGTTAGDALRLGEPGGGPAGAPGSAVIAARVNGELRDLAAPLADGDSVEPVEVGSDDGRAIMRHSTAHVMAQAVQELFPEAKLGIGPPVENGFYYDFDVPAPFSPEDLKAIEQRMRQIVKQGQRFSRREVSDDQAREELAGEPYKLELIGIKGGAAAPDAGPRSRPPRSASRKRSRSAAASSPSTTTSTPPPARNAGRTCAAGRTCPPPGRSRRSS